MVGKGFNQSLRHFQRKRLPHVQQTMRSCQRHGAGGEMVLEERETLNTLFAALQEWNDHLAHLDAERLGCDDDAPTP